jgi:hypothetical protein
MCVIPLYTNIFHTLQSLCIALSLSYFSYPYWQKTELYTWLLKVVIDANNPNLIQHTVVHFLLHDVIWHYISLWKWFNILCYIIIISKSNVYKVKVELVLCYSTLHKHFSYFAIIMHCFESVIFFIPLLAEDRIIYMIYKYLQELFYLL